MCGIFYSRAAPPVARFVLISSVAYLLAAVSFQNSMKDIHKRRSDPSSANEFIAKMLYLNAFVSILPQPYTAAIRKF